MPGQVLADRYRVAGLPGRGGMGEVCEAEDLELEQVAALKFPPEALSRDRSEVGAASTRASSLTERVSSSAQPP